MSTPKPKASAYVATRQHFPDFLLNSDNWMHPHESIGQFLGNPKTESSIFYDINAWVAYLESKIPDIFSTLEQRAGFDQFMLKAQCNVKVTSRTPQGFRTSESTNEYNFSAESMIASIFAWRVDPKCTDEKKTQIKYKVDKVSLSSEKFTAAYPKQTNGWLVLRYEGDLEEFKTLLQDECLFRKKNRKVSLVITNESEHAIAGQILSQITQAKQEADPLTVVFTTYLNQIIGDISKGIGRYTQKLADQKAATQLKAEQAFQAEQAEQVCVEKSENCSTCIFTLTGNPKIWKESKDRYWQFFFTSVGDGLKINFPFEDGDKVLLPENMTDVILNNEEIRTVDGKKSFKMNSQSWEDWKPCFTKELIFPPPARPTSRAPTRPKAQNLLVSTPIVPIGQQSGLAAVSDDEYDATL